MTSNTEELFKKALPLYQELPPPPRHVSKSRVRELGLFRSVMDPQ